MKNIKKLLKSRLPKEIYSFLVRIGRIADASGCNVFCVGGFVRDLLLGVKNFDIDITVEKSGIRFAKILNEKLKRPIVIYEKFGTATIFSAAKNVKKLDIATARTETYNYPAALPVVKFASIKDDLYRRDFTINALAISINSENFGDIIDFFNGISDLKSKTIRALHDLSFTDDPTRIFRAVRFEQRLNFKIEPHTEKLIIDAASAGMFEKTQSQRLREEIILILSESSPLKTLERMYRLGELSFMDSELKITKKTRDLFKKINRVRHKKDFSKNEIFPQWWLIYFMALVDDLLTGNVRALCARFVFSKEHAKRIISSKKYSAATACFLDKKSYLQPSDIYSKLIPLSLEEILLVFAKTKTVAAKKRITVFLRKSRFAKLAITGHDLEKIGIKSGPCYRKILDAVLREKINGKIKTKQDELALVKNNIKY